MMRETTWNGVSNSIYGQRSSTAVTDAIKSKFAKNRDINYHKREQNHNGKITADQYG